MPFQSPEIGTQNRAKINGLQELIESNQISEPLQKRASNECDLPIINRATFLKNRKKNSVHSTLSEKELTQKQAGENEFRQHALRAKNNKSTIQSYSSELARFLNDPKSQGEKNPSKGLFKSLHTKKRRSLSNRNQQGEGDVYLTPQERELRFTKKRLVCEFGKFMPRNSSFTLSYGEKKEMIQKQAEAENSKEQQNFFPSQESLLTEQDRKKKQLILQSILDNRRINFGRKRSLPLRSNPTMPTKAKMNPPFLQFSTLRSRSDFRTQEQSEDKSALETKSKQRERREKIMKEYLSTISLLHKDSEAIKKESESVVKLSIKKQGEFTKQYDDLKEQTSEVIFGFSNYILPEQNSPEYLKELQQMWFNNGAYKGKSHSAHKK